MQFHKKKNNLYSNEKSKMINFILSDEINNVCFECGTNNPEYISINNAVFICKECVQDHFQFPHEISQIIINDLKNLNNNDIKKLYLGGNKKLIEFINFDFPRLKQCPPSILYKTRAVDYYRKRLEFFVQGGIRPLKPIFEYAYQMVNIPNTSNISNYKKDIYLSPKVNLVNERYSSTTKLTPISEANQNEDENNNSEYSDDKDKNNNNNKENNIIENNTNRDNNNENINQQNISNENEKKEKKERNNYIYSPKKPKHINRHNNSAFISPKTRNSNRSFDNKNNIIRNLISETKLSPLGTPYKKQVVYDYKNNNHTKTNKNDDKNNSYTQTNKNDDLNINMNLNSNIESDKNISDFITLNNNEKSITNINDDNYGDDNTIKAINKYMNNSKESDFFFSKNTKEKDNIINDQNTINENENKNNINEIDERKKEENNKIQNNDNDNNNNKKEKIEEKETMTKIFVNDNNKNDLHTNVLNNNNLNSNDKVIDRVTKTNQIEIINISDDNDNFNDNNKDNISNNKDNNENITNNKKEYEKKNKTINANSKNIKVPKILSPKDLDTFSEKRENTKKRHLKAKITTKEVKTEYEDDDFYDDIYPTHKSNKIIPYKNKKNDYFKNETNDIIPFDGDIFPKSKKDNFYSDAGSNFINPLKYLKRSFQKKQEEKFGYDSDENSDSYEDELENNNSIKLIGNINASDMVENENIKNDKHINKEYKEINMRTRNSMEKEGDTKESTESQQDDKNNSIRQKYKNKSKY